MINIWLVFRILEIVVNFIRITYTFYVDLGEILAELSASNRKSMSYNISW